MKDAGRFHPLVRACKDRIDELAERPIPACHKLLAAIVGRAILDCSRQEENLRIDAKDWIVEEPKRNYMAPYRPWSFNWMCEHLNFSSVVKKEITLACCEGRRLRVNLVDFY